MDQIDSITTENNVFNRQQSIDDDSTTHTNNNEVLIAVWLQTASITTNKNFDSIKSKIENDVDSLSNFIDDSEGCENYIQKQSKNVKIFFILSNEYARVLLKNTHDLQVIHSIYIYDEISNKEDIKNYSKVINVYTDLNKLTDELSSIVYNYSRYVQLPITIFKQRYEQDQTTSLLNKFAYFVDFRNPLFIDLLFDLPSTDYEQQKATFIEQCKIYYRANESVLKVIDEFKNTYKPEFSILWYKRDSFVYRLMNKAMRQQNIHGILLLRFFILDLFKQLNQIYHGFIDSKDYEDNCYDDIYRGQLMFANELDNLKKNMTHGIIISINSFFSASRTQGVALKFSGVIDTDNSIAASSKDIKSVLFEIRIKYDHKNRLKRKPFADVSHLSDREKLYEQEIIFMVGSFFQLDDISEKEIEALVDEKKVKIIVTLVKLTLINEDNLSIPIMKDYQILKSTNTIEGKLIRIGNLLIDHSLSIRSSGSKVDAYYRALNNEPNLMMTAACLTGQAWVALKKEQYDLAIKLALKALSIDDKSNDELAITTLNCLGGIYSKLKNYSKALKYYTEAYNLSKPTDDKIANNSYKGPCIPIDKYAMYDNYRNISSINIACIYQKKGDIQLAWKIYKEAVDCEMRDTTDFHCHTCMTIAESGTHEIIRTSEEHNRIWTNWKSFLDLGLVDILKYRTPVVTGYLSLSDQYDFPSRRYNNNHCRTMAIDYFRKVESQCIPYASNHQYYLYTLQCYERLAVLYQYWDNRSIDYYEKMIRLCLKYNPDDLENIVIGYEGMVETYEKQQSNRSDGSKNISMLLCADPIDRGVRLTETPLTPPMFGTLFQNIKPLHFAFGCYEKWIDPQLKNESDLRKKIIYCHMKLAAFYYDQEKTVDAKHSLNKAISLCQQFGSEMLNIRKICNENLLFINKYFDFIIQSYMNRLPPVINMIGDCIDENNYCYIAQLYEKKNDFNLAFQYLQEPIKYFQRYNYVCLHTIDCYIKLAKHYQIIKNDKMSTVNTYERAINLIKKHRSNRMITTISIIEEHLINYFKRINDIETTIAIYETLCTIIRYETTDISVLYNHFKRVLNLLIHKHNAVTVVLNVYDAFLNFILTIINPLSSQMTMVLTHFRDHSINAYKKFNKLLLAIEIYQKLICLLLKHENDTRKLISEYKIIAAGFKTKHLLEDSVLAYENLLNFVCQHHSTGGFSEEDLIHFVFYVWNNEIIKQYLVEKKFNSAISLYYKMIHFLEDYRLNINKNYNLNDFISETLQNYDEIAMIYQSGKNNFDKIMNIYQEQIEFLTKYQIETIQEHINTIFSKCQQFAVDHKEQGIQIYSKLVIFIEKNRLNYLSDLSIAYRELAELDHTVDKLSQQFEFNNSDSCRIVDLRQRIFDYKQKAKNYLDNNQLNKAKAVYRNEILPFLLENHARDDEQIAICYRQMASLYYKENARQALEYYQKVIDIYEKQKDDFYTEYAFELNSNVCRRYAGTIFMCYDSMKRIYIALKDQISIEICEQKVVNILEKYKGQFYFIVNPLTNIITIEIRPFVELGY